MHFRGLIFLVVLVISYFGDSQPLPLSLDKEPSIVQMDLLWSGKKYCLRFLTMDVIGTENDLKQALGYVFKHLDENKESSTNSDISKNVINRYKHRNTVADESRYKLTNYKAVVINGKFGENSFAGPALENRLKSDGGNDIPRNEETGIRKDIINLIFVTPKSRIGTERDNDEVVFPTEENLDYSDFTHIPTGITVLDRADLPAAIVASLLG